MPIAPDFKGLLRKYRQYDRSELEPDHYLWTFDSSDGKVYIGHNRGRHPAHHLTHETVAPHVAQERATHGYAHPIKGGYRITDWDHHEVKDPYIVGRVLTALRGEHPEPSLPHISYHRL